MSSSSRFCYAFMIAFILLTIFGEWTSVEETNAKDTIRSPPTDRMEEKQRQEVIDKVRVMHETNGY